MQVVALCLNMTSARRSFSIMRPCCRFPIRLNHCRNQGCRNAHFMDQHCHYIAEKITVQLTTREKPGRTVMDSLWNWSWARNSNCPSSRPPFGQCSSTRYIHSSCLARSSMLQISQFDVDASELHSYPIVSQRLRDIAKSEHTHDDGAHEASHHGHHCAAMASSMAYVVNRLSFEDLAARAMRNSTRSCSIRVRCDSSSIYCAFCNPRNTRRNRGNSTPNNVSPVSRRYARVAIVSRRKCAFLPAFGDS